MARALILALVASLVSLAGPAGAMDRFAASCRAADIQVQIDASSTGDRVLVPAGFCTWTTPITVTGKAIEVQGAGAAPPIGAATTNGTNITLSGTPTAWVGVSEATDGHVVLSNFTFSTSDSSRPSFAQMVLTRTRGGQPIVLHHISVNDGISSGTGILDGTSRSVIYRSQFINSTRNNGQAFYRCDVNADESPGLWTSPSTFGTADTANRNLYIETNIIKYYNQGVDFSSACRAVFRYNTVTNSTLSGHGPDSNFGIRHAEFYNNTFKCELTTPNQNLAGWISQRGGTFAFHDNTFDLISSDCALGARSDIGISLFNIRAGPGCCPCWTGSYPDYRQPGWGYISGGTTVNGQAQDLEPMYEWGNTRTGGGQINFAIGDFPFDNCGNGLTAGMFVKQNREYYLGTIKPNYTPYPYPHSLDTSSSQSLTAPSNLRIR